MSSLLSNVFDFNSWTDFAVAIPLILLSASALFVGSQTLYVWLFSQVGPYLVQPPQVRVTCQETQMLDIAPSPAADPGQ
jgi:hypothetical protein